MLIKSVRILSVMAAAGMLGAGATDAHDTPSPVYTLIAMPIMNPEQGKQLFIEKGCVTCHAVNGVGGTDAPALDSKKYSGIMNPFDFPARMWNHAEGMIASQKAAFGEQIQLTGNELANLTAFIHTEILKRSLKEGEIPPEVMKMMDHGHGDDAGHHDQPAAADAPAKSDQHGDDHTH